MAEDGREVDLTDEELEVLAGALRDAIAAEMDGERSDEVMARIGGMIADMLQGEQADTILEESVDIILDEVPGVGRFDMVHGVAYRVVDRLLGERADVVIRRTVDTTMGELTQEQNEAVIDESLRMSLEILEREGRLEPIARAVADESPQH